MSESKTSRRRSSGAPTGWGSRSGTNCRISMSSPILAVPTWGGPSLGRDGHLRSGTALKQSALTHEQCAKAQRLAEEFSRAATGLPVTAWAYSADRTVSIGWCPHLNPKLRVSGSHAVGSRSFWDLEPDEMILASLLLPTLASGLRTKALELQDRIKLAREEANE